MKSETFKGTHTATGISVFAAVIHRIGMKSDSDFNCCMTSSLRRSQNNNKREAINADNGRRKREIPLRRTKKRECASHCDINR